MKTKVVEYLASEAQAYLVDTYGELDLLRTKYPELFGDTKTHGPGLDLAVAREKLNAAMKLVNLLT